MSLLLDALKITGQVQPYAAPEKPSNPGTPELTLVDLPEIPQQKEVRQVEDDLERLSAGKLFSAKPVRARTRPGIVPLALAAALTLAAVGSYYVWSEISPSQVIMHQNPAPAPAFIAVASESPSAPATLVLAPRDTPVVPAITPNGRGNYVAPDDETSHARFPLSSSDGTTSHSTRLHNDRSQVDGYLPEGERGQGSLREFDVKSHPVAEEKRHAARRTPAPAAAAPQALAANAAQPIRIEHVQEIAAVDPDLLAGYQAYRNGDLDTALKHYGDVLQRDVQNHNTPNRDALLGLAAIAQQQSQDATAAQYYRQVLALDPRDPTAHAGMSALFGTADTAGTESRLKLLLAQQPQSAALHFALGNHYADQSRWGEAQQSYFEAVNRDSDNGHFAFNLAVSLDHLGQGKLAAQYYQRALQLSPSGNTGFDRAQAQQRANELAAY